MYFLTAYDQQACDKQRAYDAGAYPHATLACILLRCYLAVWPNVLLRADLRF